MYMQFYVMKDRLTQKDFFVYCNQEAKTWEIISQNITHHITIGKFVLLICIWKMPYLKLIIRLFTNRPTLCSPQTIQFYSHQFIRFQSRKTVLFCKDLLMSYVRTGT